MLCEPNNCLVLVLCEQVQQLLLANDKGLRAQILVAKEQKVECEEDQAGGLARSSSRLEGRRSR